MKTLKEVLLYIKLAIKECGYNCSKIRKYVPTRTTVQIRTRIQKHKANLKKNKLAESNKSGDENNSNPEENDKKSSPLSIKMEDDNVEEEKKQPDVNRRFKKPLEFMPIKMNIDLEHSSNNKPGLINPLPQNRIYGPLIPPNERMEQGFPINSRQMPSNGAVFTNMQYFPMNYEQQCGFLAQIFELEQVTTGLNQVLMSKMIEIDKKLNELEDFCPNQNQDDPNNLSYLLKLGKTMRKQVRKALAKNREFRQIISVQKVKEYCKYSKTDD